jgi:hypothetical protein
LLELVGSDVSSGAVQALITVLSKSLPSECETLCNMLIEKVLVPEDEEEEKEEGEEGDKEKEKEEDGDKKEEKVPSMFKGRNGTILSRFQAIPNWYDKNGE